MPTTATATCIGIGTATGTGIGVLYRGRFNITISPFYKCHYKSKPGIPPPIIPVHSLSPAFNQAGQPSGQVAATDWQSLGLSQQGIIQSYRQAGDHTIIQTSRELYNHTDKTSRGSYNHTNKQGNIQSPVGPKDSSPCSTWGAMCSMQQFTFSHDVRYTVCIVLHLRYCSSL